MNLDRELIARTANERGFGPSETEKALRLLDLLAEIRRHPHLRERVVLKGGTALNLFHFDCPRLSVDIDLNYLGGPSLEHMRRERPELLRALEVVCAGTGLRVEKRNPGEHANETWVLRYRSVVGPQDHVQIDVNFLMRVCLYGPESRVARFAAGPEPISFPVLTIEELMAGKAVALLDRAAARDLYDAYCFARDGVPHDRTRLRRAFILFAVSALPRTIWDYDAGRANRVTEERIERELWPVLRRGARPDLRTMTETVAPLLESLLALSDDERRFAESVYAGEPQPQHLFPDDPVLAERAGSHPALAWKVRNVIEFRERNPGP